MLQIYFCRSVYLVCTVASLYQCAELGSMQVTCTSAPRECMILARYLGNNTECPQRVLDECNELSTSCGHDNEFANECWNECNEFKHE